ncbi:hypothetical protein SOP93_26965 [Peribacillus frigoritolerans]|uniref:hypothetical protein n=1 Tax=Peribacillus frigoritolerans TaxID=450367 RepID=UPI002B250B44|nr:hypothetical protein [Peribacillus frigoritolerans]MEB2494717.1 hypothetical protein [Peribacillus frigoritolerans]
MLEMLGFLIYVFLLMIAIILIESLPFITLPAVIISLFRKKNIKRSIAALAVIPLIKLFNNLNRKGMGPSESEYFLSQILQANIWIILSFVGYCYLLYWWVTFLKRRKKHHTEPIDELEGKKSFKTKGFLILVGVVLLLGIPLASFFYQDSWKETTVLTSESPTETSTIEIVQKGEPTLFSSAPFKIYYQKKGHSRYSIRESVDNDGGFARTENFRVDWKDNENATVTIIGDEGYTETIEINVSEKPKK